MKTMPSPIIFFDQKLMPTYKSVTYMLEQKLIKEPDPLIINHGKGQLQFNPTCNAFLYLERLAKKKTDGYAIIRVKNKQEAKFLEWNINQRIKGKQIFIKHWNQKEKIDPQTYFKDLREGVLVVVIVQKKAAMGNSIPTDHMKMMYDYSPNAKLSTIAQGLLGRCCGHGKRKHLFPIFTHVGHAKAYSLFEQGKMADFAKYLHDNKIGPSARSKIHKKKTSIYHGTFTPKSKVKSKEEARELVKEELINVFGEDVHIDGTISARFLSDQKNQEQRKWYLDAIKKGVNPITKRSLDNIPGRTTLFYDERSNTIYYGIRRAVNDSYGIQASDNSFYNTL